MNAGSWLAGSRPGPAGQQQAARAQAPRPHSPEAQPARAILARGHTRPGHSRPWQREPTISSARMPLIPLSYRWISQFRPCQEG